jgi:glycosyltransferase involved in cell wall biosynthesis
MNLIAWVLSLAVALLTAILNQKTYNVEIDQVVVVSSGSTDKTDTIVEDFTRKDSRIVLIRQI